MAHPSFGNGYPNCSTERWVPLVYNDAFAPGVEIHEELLELVLILCTETERRGYKLRRHWCWCAACRMTTSGSGPSNHSWGTAVDLNAPTNPYGSGVTDMPDWMPILWHTYGFFQLAHDRMHYEFRGSVVDARRQTAKAIAAFGSGESEDDMKFEQFQAGWTLHAKGRQIDEEWPGPKKFGWRARQQAVTLPKAEPSGNGAPHEHNSYALKTHGHEVVGKTR